MLLKRLHNWILIIFSAPPETASSESEQDYYSADDSETIPKSYVLRQTSAEVTETRQSGN